MAAECFTFRLQQYLPLAVLKPIRFSVLSITLYVATVLTVYGIETICRLAQRKVLQPLVATVLTVYGIETVHHGLQRCEYHQMFRCNSTYRLRY